MLADLKPYPVMKNSGVPWLGSVPEHWDIRRGKWLFRYRKQINSDRTSTNVLSLTLRGVVNNDPDNPEGLVPKDYATYQLFRKGDLVFKLIDLENLRTSRVGLVHEDGIMSSAYVRLTSHAVVDIRFFFQQYFDLYQRGIYNQLGAGVRSTLGQDDLLNLSVVVPPLFEQAAIVHFLNYADRRIQRYIHAKQKLIKLLEEQKQVIIHRAVTRGLDPSVPFKPSRVEWLGDVPEHWEMWQIGHFSRVGNGSTPSRGTAAYWTGGHYPWLNSAYANQESITRADQFVTDIALQECHLPIVPPSSVLVAITGQGKTRGKAAVLHIEATINQHMAFITPRPNVTSADYLRLALHGAYSQLRSISDDSGSTKGALTCADLKHFQLALPPLHEQGVILEAVQNETRVTSAAIDRAQRDIALLREYRTRLISDVVTGKLDVREAAARLPDEPAASEQLDESEALAEGEESGDDADPGAAPEEAEA